ncbi:hypothetical protein A0H76_1263 [Hepatospora eriocheir]|uniref:Uncharacterized protein n=1 Tax=Hepatospora eriocheir TaxID=1081669 RepID=A0A1X0QKT0_9MICR|nr:hypothetical protein A0H76_1263 [Hepatospora eriocheir]
MNICRMKDRLLKNKYLICVFSHFIVIILSVIVTSIFYKSVTNKLNEKHNILKKSFSVLEERYYFIYDCLSGIIDAIYISNINGTEGIVFHEKKCIDIIEKIKQNLIENKHDAIFKIQLDNLNRHINSFNDAKNNFREWFFNIIKKQYINKSKLIYTDAVLNEFKEYITKLKNIHKNFERIWKELENK